jgi:hypothetical protein
MKKYLIIFISSLFLGCSNSDSEPVVEVITEKDKLAFKRCAGVVKSYGSHPEKFEYYPNESTNFTNQEGREVVTLALLSAMLVMKKYITKQNVLYIQTGRQL